MNTIKTTTNYLAIFFTILLISSFQTRLDKKDYNKQWQSTDAYVKTGQPKSALKIVDEIYKSAKAEDNSPQIIKSLIYRISLQSSFEEDYIINSITTFQNELASASVPEKQILQSLIAELYQAYYNANRWKINERQSKSENDDNDINTWDAVKLNQVITDHYTASLENEKSLSEIPLNDYNIILLQADSSNFTLWPSLFDLLANRALSYFTSADVELTQIGSSLQTNNINYFKPVSEYINLKINPEKSSKTKALRLFQRLLALHIKQNNTEALVDLDLRRLQYAYQNSAQSADIEKVYTEALTLLSNKFKNHPVYAVIAFKLANQYFITGSDYFPCFDEHNRFHLLKADSICKTVLKAFPEVNGSDNCRNLIERINQIDFGFDIPVAEMPDMPILSLVRFKNVNTLYFKIVIGDPLQNAKKEDRKTYLLNELKQEVVVSWKQELPETNDHRMHSVEIKIPELSHGYYIIFASNDSLFSTTQYIKFKPIWITSLSYITSANKAGGYTDMFTINRETGKSIGDVNITMYKRQYDNRSRTYTINEAGKLTSDKYGYGKIESLNNNNYGTYLFMFEKDGNQLFSENYLTFYKQKNDLKPSVKTYLFTDRSVYQPGQTVYFKGIVIEKLGDEVKLIGNYNTELEFINASRKRIKTTGFKTNNNGSFNGSFIIPTGGLNGQMTIKSSTGNVSFIVENYKLPTFEVIFDSLRGQPKLGEKVKITGNAISYAGSVVDGANVKYRVVRRAVFPGPHFRDKGWYPPNIFGREIEITNGNLITASEGTFEFLFEAMPDNSIPAMKQPVFNYLISAEVTDITGEVQSGSTNVKIGNKSVSLTFEIPDVVEINNLNNQTITSTNINGTAIGFNATISLYQLTPPVRLLNKREWALPDLYIIPEPEFKQDFPHAIYKNEDDPHTWEKIKISAEQLSINGKIALPASLFSGLIPGEYMIVAEGIDDFGDPVENKHFFTLFSSSGKKLPGNMINWYALSETEAEPGEIIKLVVGSAASKSKLMYEIVNGEDIVERKWITLNKGQKTIDIPIKEEYRGNFSINLAMVKLNRLYSNQLNVTVPFSNKELDIDLETFRSHLTPGAKEEWKVTISGNNGQKLAAELLAGMYDAALDVFRQNNWQMSLYHNKRQSARWQSNQFNTSFSSTLTEPELIYYKVARIEYPSVNWFGYQFIGNNYIIHSELVGGYRKSAVADDSFILNEEESANADGGEVVNEDVTNESDAKKQSKVIPLRKNFNETAFFYPNLKTDSLGNAVFKFTTPDALTEWKVMMLAYTSDLKVGSFERKIKSQKELMIIPNLPRFVRQGDTLLFTAKVINFTDKEISITAQIEFFDAITLEPLLIFIDGNKIITQTINPKQSGSVSWGISIPDDVSMIAYRITASSGSFSDGEERMFPVLTNRMLVTNTMPLNVSALSTENFTFDGLSELDKQKSSLKNYRYTIEFTSNPAWYAIQALPYLSEPKNKSTMAFFSSYYANALSAFIVNSNPKIKSVFESWKHITPNAFLSNLEKNESLKNTILSSTPWVLDAEDETEQKRRISMLFDVTRMADEKDNILNKLQKAQLNSGAWPWFEGMQEDRHTTQTIVLGIAKLHHKGVLNISSDNLRLQMVRQAVAWLDAKIADDFIDIKKKKGTSIYNYHIRSSQTQYLYLRALLIDIIPLPEKSKDAFEYYVGQMKKYWLNQSNLLQGMIAISLNKFGYRNESEAIIRSLKERSIYNKEMGMYWRQDAGWNWYEAPVETQAMMIETMAELDNNPTIIEQLKICLLKQKQTQHWNTSSATAEAVFALLMYGNNDLDNNNLVNLTVGNQTIDIKGNPDITAEAGTGYFSTSWTGGEISNELSNILVTNPNNNIAWGAAYWQYFEDMDKIKSHDSPLSITKKLFVEKLTNEGPVLDALEPNQTLSTGDKIVVMLTIVSDRTMEYIHLKDMRATTFEPVTSTSGYSYNGGLWYYKNISDVSIDFFIRYLNKGTYILEYPLYVTQKGDFTNGIATIQSMYAPEFAAHSEGLRVKVGEE
ncbi:MAG: hypothetical protein H8E34_06885 [Bacteroidetes bacterium]|nr:hypothetical protein [Bacteroidota bacterium]MBL6943404.1 hypothetical protein [Bacteroidales bacterium]